MEEIKFEKALKRLEEIVEKLEEGDLDLDQSLKLFEEGVKLSKVCNKRLNEAQKKIEILTKENGELKTEPFGEEELEDTDKEGEIES
jgi:exodeoxyribonuclease VII small subunit